MANFKETASELVGIYKPLKGKEFEAYYQGERKMPFKGTMRSVLVIFEGNPLVSMLADISSTVLQNYGTDVWKGITGPKDSDNFEDYWLWVNNLSPALEEGNKYVFKIISYTVFQGSGEFSCGISIKASMIKEVSDSE